MSECETPNDENDAPGILDKLLIIILILLALLIGNYTIVAFNDSYFFFKITGILALLVVYAFTIRASNKKVDQEMCAVCETEYPYKSNFDITCGFLISLTKTYISLLLNAAYVILLIYICNICSFAFDASRGENFMNIPFPSPWNIIFFYFIYILSVVLLIGIVIYYCFIFIKPKQKPPHDKILKKVSYLSGFFIIIIMYFTAQIKSNDKTEEIRKEIVNMNIRFNEIFNNAVLMKYFNFDDENILKKNLFIFGTVMLLGFIFGIFFIPKYSHTELCENDTKKKHYQNAVTLGHYSIMFMAFVMTIIFFKN